MATYTKQVSGKWRAQVRRQGIYQNRTFAKKADAVAWASQIEQAIDRGSAVGTIAPSKGMTLSLAVNAYLDAVPINAAARPTLLAMCRAIGDIPLASLNSFALQRWIDARRADGVAGATIARNLGLLSGVLKWLRHTRQIDIDENLARNARRSLAAARVSTTSLERDRLPTDEELATLRAFFAGQKALQLPMVDIMDFALASAFRLGEICRIQWDDYSHNEGTIFIRDRKDPKRKIGNHQTVPLSSVARAIIERQPRTSDRIFPAVPHSVSAAWIYACNACGIDDLHYHDLRHAAITNLFKRGLAIEQVALISGHKTWAQLRRYAQLQARDLVDLLG